MRRVDDLLRLAVQASHQAAEHASLVRGQRSCLANGDGVVPGYAIECAERALKYLKDADAQIRAEGRGQTDVL